MFDNKYALIAAVVLFAGAAGYNVWFFILQGEGNGASGLDGGSPVSERPARVTGGPETADSRAREGDSARSGLEALVRAARDGRLPVRPAAEFERVMASASGEAAWGRDPMALSRAPEPTVQPPSWQLGAVMTGADRNVAVIDGQVYAEGDRIDGGTVVSVRSGRVVIRWRGRRIVLELE